MHAGVVEHYNSEGIGVFLCDKLVKRLDDRLGGHRHGHGVVDQFSSATEEPQYIQPSAVWVGGHFTGLSDRPPLSA